MAAVQIFGSCVYMVLYKQIDAPIDITVVRDFLKDIGTPDTRAISSVG